MTIELNSNTKQTGIYKIVNNINQKIYIGSAAKSFYDRWHLHLLHLKKGDHHSKPLQNAFNKYGENNFEFVIVEICNDFSKILEREQYYLDLFKPFPKNKTGYNVLTNAQNSLGFKHSQVTINKAKQRQKQKAIEIAQIDKQTLKIIAKWASINEAVKTLKVQRSTVTKCLRNQLQYACGFIWKKWDERFDAKQVKSKLTLPVYQFDKNTQKLIKKWDSISKAANFYNIHQTGIRAAMDGKTNTCNSFIWRRTEQ